MCLQGLAALLVQGLSGCSPEEVAGLDPGWIAGMGLQQSLTPSRNNGFFNMYALMRQKAAALCGGGAAAPLQASCWPLPAALLNSNACLCSKKIAPCCGAGWR